jgi:hypothetical protein
MIWVVVVCDILNRAKVSEENKALIIRAEVRSVRK